MTYSEIVVGDSAFCEKTLTETDLYNYAGITGDFGPPHINERYAQNTRFGHRIVHGVLTTGLFSTVFAMQLPGPGTIFLSLSVNFVAPVFIGDTVKATVTVTEKLPKGRVQFDCLATNQRDESVVTGSAVLLAPRG